MLEEGVAGGTRQRVDRLLFAHDEFEETVSAVNSVESLRGCRLGLKEGGIGLGRQKVRVRLCLLLLLEKMLQVVGHLSDLELFPQRLQLLQFHHMLLLLLILLLGRLGLGLSEKFVDEEAASVGYLRGCRMLVQALERWLLLKLIACGGF